MVMNKPIEKLRILVLALLLPGLGCMFYGHSSGNASIKSVGWYMLVVAVVLSLLPLVLFFLSSLFGSKK